MVSKKKMAITVVAIVLLSFVGVNLVKGKKTETIAAAPPSQVSVRVAQADTVTKNPTLSYKATLEASEQGIIASKISGKVLQIFFENGKNVTQGEALIKLDDQDIQNNIASAESKLHSTQMTVEKTRLVIENAQRSYDRQKALWDQGAISKVEMENAETALKNAQIDYETAKANLNAAQIDLNNLRSTLANTTITAPISGVIDEKNVDLGQYITTGTVLGKIKQISPINAVIDVDQNTISSLTVGQSVKVKVGTDTVKEYEGTIKSISPSADPTSRVFKTKVEIHNQDQFLKPGIYATVEIESNKKTDMIAVPTEALTGSEGNYSVFVNENGTARKHSVSIGEITNGFVEIKSGLSKGDNVIITNVNTLQDGDEVIVVTE